MNILVLTGAGISAESGIATFRAQDGLWEGYQPEQVATPEAFERDPLLVQRFYNQRRAQLQQTHIQPNAAHYALAEFERRHTGDFLLVTQNVDNLHQRAGSRRVLAMHGELMKARCMDTGAIFAWTQDLDLQTPHPHAGHPDGRLRPHVVWFGETPLGLEMIEQAAAQADMFVAIGTSSVVYPAASIVQWTRSVCRRIEINLEETPKSPHFDETIRAAASSAVPEFFKRLSHAAE